MQQRLVDDMTHANREAQHVSEQNGALLGIRDSGDAKAAALPDLASETRPRLAYRLTPVPGAMATRARPTDRDMGACLKEMRTVMLELAHLVRPAD